MRTSCTSALDRRASDGEVSMVLRIDGDDRRRHKMRRCAMEQHLGSAHLQKDAESKNGPCSMFSSVLLVFSLQIASLIVFSQKILNLLLVAVVAGLGFLIDVR